MEVKVKIQKSVTTKFTEDEKNALKLVGSIECVGIDCCDCPFNKKFVGSNMCLCEEIRHIYEESIYNES